MEVVNAQTGLQIMLTEKLIIKLGEATVNPAGKHLLNSIAEKLKEFDRYRAVVSGHTHNIQIPHSSYDANNWELSSAWSLWFPSCL